MSTSVIPNSFVYRLWITPIGDPHYDAALNSMCPMLLTDLEEDVGEACLSSGLFFSRKDATAEAIKVTAAFKEALSNADGMERFVYSFVNGEKWAVTLAEMYPYLQCGTAHLGGKTFLLAPKTEKPEDLPRLLNTTVVIAELIFNSSIITDD